MLNNSAVLSNVTCYSGSNGSIDLQAWGGTAPYTYLWTTGSSNQDITGLTVGNYSVTITDNKGCVKSSNYTITQPTIITSQMNSTPVTCFGFSNGIASVIATGGTSPYAYNWQNTNTVFAQNSATLANVPASTYTVNITDANGCSISNSTTISQPSVVSSSLTFTNVNCHGGNDGSINLSVSGGNAPYGYTWVNAANQNIAVTQDLLQIPADTFTVTITDANGCVTEMDFVVENETTANTISLMDVSLFLSPNPSDGDVRIKWKGAASQLIIVNQMGSVILTKKIFNTQTTEVLDLPSGLYSVKVIGVNGSTASRQLVII